jgi:hypothetical protein
MCYHMVLIQLKRRQTAKMFTNFHCTNLSVVPLFLHFHTLTWTPWKTVVLIYCKDILPPDNSLHKTNNYLSHKNKTKPK